MFVDRIVAPAILVVLSTGCGPRVRGQAGGSTGVEATMTGDDGSAGSGGHWTGTTDPETGGGDAPGFASVLFVVGNNVSMDVRQETLSRAAVDLVAGLDDAGVDYRIAVTTTDYGNSVLCSGTSPERGAFVASSCRARPQDFMLPDYTFPTCTNNCSLEELAFVPTLIEPDGSEAVRPWIEVRDGIGNVDNGSASEALSCVLLQGLNGCGYVQPLESLFRAIERTQDPTAPEYGFFGPGSLPVIVILTDRLDCSFEPEHEEAIFSSEGPKTFWSSDEPSSAICWNAGVACDPGWNCEPAYLDALGSPVAPEQGVMRPVERYAQALTDLEAVTGDQALLTAIVGTGLDGSVVYGPARDPAVEDQYGVGLACGEPFFDGAVPTVRIRELVEAQGGSLHSVCADSYAPAMQALASEVIQRMAGG